MNSKTFAIGAALAAALLAGIFSATTPMAVYAVDDYDDEDHDDEERDNEEEEEDSESSTRSENDEDDSDNDERDNDMNGDYSATNTEQKLKQTNDGSGASTNFNCGENSIDGGFIDAQVCGTLDLDLGDEGTTTLEICNNDLDDDRDGQVDEAECVIRV